MAAMVTLLPHAISRQSLLQDFSRAVNPKTPLDPVGSNRRVVPKVSPGRDPVSAPDKCLLVVSTG